MTLTKLWWGLAAVIILTGRPAHAEFGPKLPPEPPGFEIDSATQTLKTLNYDIEVPCFTDAGLDFTTTQKTPAMYFYFSAKCPHCQQAIPEVCKMAKKLAKDSVKVYAIAVGNNREGDLAEFITKYKVDIPVFHDTKRLFARNYGTGRVPLVLLANTKGNYALFKGFNEDETPQQIFAALQDKSMF